MKTVMVTGSSGQLGTRLTKNLSEAGFNVIGIGTRQISENVNNFNSYIKFDLLKDDFDSLIKQIRPKILIHLAWETEPKTFWA
jgi:nucleoside-diphosphate-sugar epimerase